MPTQTLRPVSTAAAGDWTASAGTRHGDTSDASDTTYVAAANANELKLGLGIGSDPASGARTLTVRARDTNEVNFAGSLTVKLYESGVLAQTFVIAAPLPAVFTDNTLTITAAVLDYSGLSVGLEATDTWVAFTDLNVSEISMEIPGSVHATAASQARTRETRTRDWR